MKEFWEEWLKGCQDAYFLIKYIRIILCQCSFSAFLQGRESKKRAREAGRSFSLLRGENGRAEPIVRDDGERAK